MRTGARALMATLGGVWTEEQAREKLLWNCDQWARHGHGQWLFFLNPSVVALTLVGNRRPERVMQKLGFSFEAEITHAGLPHVLYRLAHPGQGVERSVDLSGGPPSAHPDGTAPGVDPSLRGSPLSSVRPVDIPLGTGNSPSSGAHTTKSPSP